MINSNKLVLLSIIKNHNFVANTEFINSLLYIYMFVYIPILHIRDKYCLNIRNKHIIFHLHSYFNYKVFKIKF